RHSLRFPLKEMGNVAMSFQKPQLGRVSVAARLRRRLSGPSVTAVVVGLSAALVTIVLAVAFSDGARGSSSTLNTAAKGGTLRAGLLSTDELVHYTVLPPGYDYFLDSQGGQTSIEWELFRR